MSNKLTTWEGVVMTDTESSKFSLWLQKQDFWINTFVKEERLNIINNWLKNYRENEKENEIY